MEFRKAGMEDIDLLTENRMEFVTAVSHIQNPEEFRRATKEYLREHLEDDLIYYICTDAGKIVSSCLLCIYRTLPLPSAINGKHGLLLNVYTLKEYRRQGLAKSLISNLICDAREMGVSRISLNYTDEGYPLYQELGFVKCDREMEMKL
ncbi:MAG: GNAT family N-acetyltransferase [Clostridia bacterium]|nr:GNAT family N-acetyltransferase [Clostridia bacterium]